MTATTVLPAPVADRISPALAALDRAATTLTGRDVDAVRSALTVPDWQTPAHRRAYARLGLDTLARAEKDLADDGHEADVETIVAALTPNRTPADRGRLWDLLCESIQLHREWSQPGAADVFADLPPGSSAEATIRAALDGYTARRRDALTGLVAP